VSILAISLVVLLAYMSALFVVAMRLVNNGVADVGYGIAFIVVILATVLQVGSLTTVQWVIVALPLIWGVRLALRIGRKNLNKPEDFRYAAWRKEWGDSVYVRSFLQIYMLQGLIVFCIALPVLLMLVFPTDAANGALTIAGVALWVVGFLFQTIGDYQLDRFVANKANKGQIMMSGLWAYSRHPNYFGESVMWWGIAIAVVPWTTLPALAFISPVLITFLLLKVSGVPMLEKRWEGHPAWEDYKRKTSVFVPMPPGQ
jgi:steroid 5-alpha reductase family enzyme